MENFDKIKKTEVPENSEKIVLRVLLQRHGPKLSASGEKDMVASYFGDSVIRGFKNMNIEKGKGLVHVSSSPIKRAMDTAAIGLEKISETEHRHKNVIGKKDGLATPFKEGTDEKYSQDLKKIVEIQVLLEPSMRQKVENEHPNLSPEEKEAEVRNLIDTEVLSILFDSEEAKKQGIRTSYEEMADNLRKRYSGFLSHMGLLESLKEKSDKHPQNESYIQIDVSHSFPIMSFLKKYLVFNDGSVARDLSPKDFFEKTGGVIKESDSLELDYKLQGEAYIVKVCGKNFEGHLNFK